MMGEEGDFVVSFLTPLFYKQVLSFLGLKTMGKTIKPLLDLSKQCQIL